MRPRRNNRRQVILPRAIRINVGRHILPVRTRLPDRRDQLRHLPPKLLIRQLEVNNIHRHPGALPDRNGLRHGFENALPLGAHVRGINPAIGRRGLTHRDQRIGVDPRSRRPAQRTRHTQRPLLHRLPHQRFHPRQFRRRRRPRLLPPHLRPDLARPHIRPDIRRNPLLQQQREVALEVSPSLLAVGRRGRTAFAENHRRHALTDHALRIAVRQQRVIGMVVDIDKTGRDNFPGGVDHALRLRARQISQRGDLPVPNRDVAQERGVPRSVRNPPVLNQYVKLLATGKAGEQYQRDSKLHASLIFS